MLRQIFRFALGCALVVTLIFFAWKSSSIPKETWQKSWIYTRAKAGQRFDQRSKIKVQGRSISAKVLISKYHLDAMHLKENLLSTLKYTFFIFPLSFCLTLLFFWGKGREDRKKRHISGQEMLPVKALRKQIIRQKEASDFHLGPLPIVKDSETQHFLITGTTGSGKTNCFHHLLPQIREKNQKAVIVDTTGVFVQSYFREGYDILLNPFDERSTPWHPWAECKEPYHYKEIAKSLIPQTSHDPFWSTSAQTIFAIVLEHLDREGEKSTNKLLKLLLEEPLEQLFDELQASHHHETRALSLLDPKSEKTATSIRSTAASFVDCLSYLEDTTQPFSIRKWIQEDTQKQWLFLSMMPDQRDTLRPLISTWSSIAIKSLLGRLPDPSSRTWFIFDELASLHQLHDLTTCLAESRKYGGAVVLGIQNLSQLDEIYGHNLTQAIVDLCSTKICFRQTSPELAHRMSKAFGEREITEMQEGISYGANDIRDGVNLSMHTKEKLTISPTELFTLENLEAYVKLAGNFPVTKIRFEYRMIEKILALPFLKKDKRKIN